MNLYHQIFLSALIASTGSAEAQAPEFVQTRASLITAQGCHDIMIEVADTPALRRHGLMFRTHIPEDEGMLLDYRHDQRVVLWMKNTPSALDMIFADSQGVVRHIHYNATPYSAEHISSQTKIKYAIEMNSGYALQKNIQIGDRFSVAPCEGDIP